ncbi:unnamed protein product [Ectocarpus sp. 8 AP-2014]
MAYSGERQAASPMAQSLARQRGSKAPRRRHSQAPHRRTGSSSIARGGGGEATVVQIVVASGGGPRASGGRRDAEGTGVATSYGSGSSSGGGGESNVHPRSQERPVRDAKGGQHEATTRASSGNGASSGSGRGSRGIAGCGEAWGATSVTTARSPAERAHSGGASTGRGGKSSNSPEAWAWAGGSGGAARGRAMLSAYGLQSDRHNPTCPRGTPSDNGVARHARWQRDQNGGGSRKLGGGGSSSGNEGGRKVVGDEENGGAGRAESHCAGSDVDLAGDETSDQASAAHVQKVCRGKSRKQHQSVAPHRRSTATSDRCSSGDRSSSYGDASAECSIGGDVAPAPEDHRNAPGGFLGNKMATAASFRESARPAGKKSVNNHAQPEEFLVPPRGSTASPHQSICYAAGSGPAAMAATSGHVEILTMDGRGGSAAPLHRPQLSLKASSSASYAPVLPGLGTGTGAGAGVIDTAEVRSGDAVGEGGGGGGVAGESHSTPPVSRQRSHSHHSPWQARKQSRGLPRSRGGVGVGRHHHHSEESRLLEERPLSGSTAGRLGSCCSSESTERASSLFSSPDSASAAAVAGAVSEPKHDCSSTASAVVVRRQQQGGGERNPFDRLLHPHTHDGDKASSCPSAAGGGAVAAAPLSELIDHFKMATRPTSRRGTRKQGGGEGECAPEPAFCLFSRGGVVGSGAGGGRGRGAEEEERRRRSSKEFGRH